MLQREEKYKSAITLLGRLVCRAPSKAHHLEDALLNYPDLGGKYGVIAAQELGEPVGKVIESIVSSNFPDQTRASQFRRSIYPYLPWPTTVLRNTAADVLGQVVADVRDHVQRKYTTEELAQALIAHGSRLGDVGMFREAFDAELEAIELLKGNERGLELTISALNNMLIHSRRLVDENREKQVIQSADNIITSLLDEHLNDSLLDHVRRILTNLAWAKFNQGGFDEAVFDNAKALSLYHGVERYDLLVELARCMINHAIFLGMATGREQDALNMSNEALALTQELADADSSSYLPELALALMNTAERHYNLNRITDAVCFSQKAIKVYKSFFDEDNYLFCIQYADCIVNHGIYCLDQGRVFEAKSLAEQALEMYESVRESEPDICKMETGMAHYLLGMVSFVEKNWIKEIKSLYTAASLFSDEIKSGNMHRAAHLTLTWIEISHAAYKLNDPNYCCKSALENAKALHHEHLGVINRFSTFFQERVNIRLKELLTIADDIGK